MSIKEKLNKFWDRHGYAFGSTLLGIDIVMLGCMMDWLNNYTKNVENRSELLEDALVITRTTLANSDAELKVENYAGKTNDLRDVLAGVTKDVGMRIPDIGDDWDMPNGYVTIPEHPIGARPKENSKKE